jgi:poly-beta-hydroxybutyrate-responsive repressor
MEVIPMAMRPDPIGMPRDFLAACLLLLLRQWSMHGYRLMQQLMALGFAALDPGTVYRTLRQLERDGLIRSHWDLGDAGPARRMYELTEAGEAFLRTWAQGLEQYRQMLDAFFRFYGLDVTTDAPATAGGQAERAGASPRDRSSARRAAAGRRAGARDRARTTQAEPSAAP